MRRGQQHMFGECCYTTYFVGFGLSQLGSVGTRQLLLDSRGGAVSPVS